MRRRFTGLLPEVFCFGCCRGRGKGYAGAPASRAPGTCHLCKGLGGEGSPEDSRGSLRTETPPGAFSDLRRPRGGSAPLLVLRGLELEVSHGDAADQATPVPAHIHEWTTRPD